MKAQDLIGQRFGRLTVLYKSSQKKGRYYPWHCKCDCGNECDVLAHYLKNGDTKSCGCLRRETSQLRGRMNGDNRETPLDLTGQQFGRLQVLSRSKTSINKHSAWKCRCLCGNVIEVRGDSLTSGNTTSCGCLKSRGEEKIGEMLRELNLPYTKEKTFPTCLNPKTQARLRFDFFVNEEYLIEFDGS